MPEYRVVFPDKEAWKINIKGKSGQDALKTAYIRAMASRAAGGKTKVIPFEDCTVQKMTAKLRASLKGLEYLTSTELLVACKLIGSDYQKKGLALTLRGMYYQLVSRGKLPSGQTEYNRVKSLLSTARLQGTFPLDLLSDSSRILHVGDATRYDLDVPHALNQAKDWIAKLDRFFLQGAKWYRQPDLPIVLFEKEALSNVFGPTCQKLGVSWMATKGYPSVSTLYELHKLMARSVDPQLLELDIDDLGYEYLQQLNPKNQDDLRILTLDHTEAMEALTREVWDSGYWTEDNEEEEGPHEHHLGIRYRYRYGDLTATEWHQGTGQTIRLLYFGDHDPDGMEIPHDLERRLRIIQVRTGEIIPFTLERLGLNQKQIEKYNPPPFWAKATSSRHSTYVAQHPWAQDRAWELDALDPIVLRKLTQNAVEDYFQQKIADLVQDAIRKARDDFNTQMRDTVLPNLLS